MQLVDGHLLDCLLLLHYLQETNTMSSITRALMLGIMYITIIGEGAFKNAK